MPIAANLFYFSLFPFLYPPPPSKGETGKSKKRVQLSVSADDPVRLAYLFPGAWFGLSALCGTGFQKQHTTVRAVEEAVVIRLERKVFGEFAVIARGALSSLYTYESRNREAILSFDTPFTRYIEVTTPVVDTSLSHLRSLPPGKMAETGEALREWHEQRRVRRGMRKG